MRKDLRIVDLQLRISTPNMIGIAGDGCWSQALTVLCEIADVSMPIEKKKEVFGEK